MKLHWFNIISLFCLTISIIVSKTDFSGVIQQISDSNVHFYAPFQKPIFSAWHFRMHFISLQCDVIFADFTKLPMSTKLLTSLPARESNWSPLELKVTTKWRVVKQIFINSLSKTVKSCFTTLLNQLKDRNMLINPSII